MRVNSTYQHPENSHLLKYFPKYYKNLGLNITQKNPLFSKIKKIKKLQRFTGCFKGNFRKANWFKVLGNNRKEIQEVPEIVLGQHLIPKKLLKARLALGNLKFFPNITRVFLPTRKDDSRQEMTNFSYITNPFLKYLRNTRRLKALEIYLTGMRNKEMNWMLERLNRMGWLLDRLHSIHIGIDDNYMNHLQELYKNKKLSSHVTGLKLPGDLTRFDQNLAMIQQLFNNLKFLSIGFDCIVADHLRFPDFMNGIQNLSSLGNLELGFVENVKYFWDSWKPQVSLHYLKLQLKILDFIKEGYTEPKNLVGHWEEIEALEYLEFEILCESADQMTFVKSLITTALNLFTEACLIDGIP